MTIRYLVARLKIPLALCVAAGAAKTLPGTRAGSCGGFSASGPHPEQGNCNATIANHFHIDR